MGARSRFGEDSHYRRELRVFVEAKFKMGEGLVIAKKVVLYSQPG